MRLSTRLAILVLLLLDAVPAAASGDARTGELLAQEHCSRCHVIGEYNKYGGLSSTPSFAGILRQEDWRERFETFYVRRPHQVFVRWPGLESPSLAPSHVTPFDFNEEKLQQLLRYIDDIRAM